MVEWLGRENQASLLLGAPARPWSWRVEAVSNAGPCAAGARREVAGPAELEQSALEEHSRRKEGSRRHEEEGRGEEGGQGAGKGLQQGSAMGGKRRRLCSLLGAMERGAEVLHVGRRVQGAWSCCWLLREGEEGREKEVAAGKNGGVGVQKCQMQVKGTSIYRHGLGLGFL